MSETLDEADEAATYDLSGRRIRDTEGVGTVDEAATPSDPEPTKEDFAKWSRVWHDTCETMTTLLGLPGCGSPQEMLAQVQYYVSARDAAQPTSQPKISIKTMRKSDDSADYFVSISVGDREVTPHVFGEEYKAAYHVALYSWLLNGTDKPDLMAFGPSLSSTDRGGK